MLSDEFLKNCFGSDDEEEEKFEIKHKKDRIVSYHPNPEQSKNKKKNKSKSSRKKNFSVENKDKVFERVKKFIPDI